MTESPRIRLYANRWFAKSDKANLSAAELKAYRKAAGIMLELGDDQIETEVEAGRLVEVKDDEQG